MDGSQVGPGFVPVKVLNIGYITSVLVAAGTGVGLLVDGAVGLFEREAADDRSVPRLLVEIVLHFWLLGVILYVARNVFAVALPSPLHGVQGLDHYRMQELTKIATFSTLLFWNQVHLNHKVKYLNRRLLGHPSCV